MIFADFFVVLLFVCLILALPVVRFHNYGYSPSLFFLILILCVLALTYGTRP